MVEIATSQEKVMTDWLRKHNIPFWFRTSLSGGYYELGDIVSILLPDNRVGLCITDKENILLKKVVAQEGWTVVNIQAPHLNRKLDEVMLSALKGEEVL